MRPGREEQRARLCKPGTATAMVDWEACWVSSLPEV